ncbi:hypothetical protein BDV11DRAFT_202203 [Aspergillus similis]
MRRGLLVFLLINLVILFFLVRSVWTLLLLLSEDGADDAIHRADVLSLNSTLVEQRPQIIPKIIHQTYKNQNIPEVWVDAQRSCMDLHPDYEYIRADSIRYFVLAYYGGIYIDLDDSNSHQGCNCRLDPLLAYPAWVRRTVPTGISNDVMGSVPQHSFFLRVIKSLQRYDRHWLLPYITVMYSTGPLFLSVIWKEYIQGYRSEMNRVRILMPDEYKKHTWSFFTHYIGNSWHGKDARLMFWMSKHWLFLTFCGFLLAAVVGFCLLWTFARIVHLGAQYRYGDQYTTVPSIVVSPSDFSYSPLRRTRGLITTLLWRGGDKRDPV